MLTRRNRLGFAVILLLSIVLLFGMGKRVEAASKIKTLQPDKVYYLKLTGTKTYKVLYTGIPHEDNENIVDLRFEIDDRYKIGIRSDWSYGYTVKILTVNSKRNLIYIADKEDNDYVDFNRIYEYKNGKVILLKDLCSLTRSKTEKADKLMTSSARGDVYSFNGKTLEMEWHDSTVATGLIRYIVSYTINGSKITKNSTSNTVRSAVTGKTNPKWTSKYTLTAYTAAGGKKKAFTVKPGEKVTLKLMTIKSGKRYLQLKNSKGKTGWILNPVFDNKRPNGYFKEAFFAG